MKKAIMLKLFYSLFIVILVGSQNVNASSITPVFGGKYTRGIDRISWYMSYENNGGWYEYQIVNAMNNWMQPGWYNPIVFVAASSNAGTMLDIYSKNASYFNDRPNVKTLAITLHYDSYGNYIDPINNYNYAEIHINDDVMHDEEVSQIRGTIIHEIGHALGLKHNNTNTNSIMCQTGYGRAVQTVQEIDNTAVVNLYS